jgi:hypothetical protein
MKVKRMRIRIRFLFVMFFIMGTENSYSQALIPDTLVKLGTTDISISGGGAALYEVDSQTFLVGVAAVQVGSKNIVQLRRVGKVKAERNVVNFVYDPVITSERESNTKEEVRKKSDGSLTTEYIDTYFERVRVDVSGFVNMMKVGGEWFSEDKMIFYYLLYKKIKLN